MSPEVQPLPLKQRRSIFLLLFVTFAIVMPLFVFYAKGYRFNLDGEVYNIVSTGGIYVSAQNDDISIYLDDEPVTNMRVFRSAAYIQNLDEGVHRIVVQAEGLETWVKELPVLPHIVTQARAFNVPRRSQIRHVTEYVSSEGQSVILASSTADIGFAFASSTNTFFVATSTATSSYSSNPEYIYVATLFASSSERANIRSMAAQAALDTTQTFTFRSNKPASTTVATSSIIAATSTKVWRDVALVEQGDDVYARWVGDVRSRPYYYCVDYVSASTTIAQYGEHVYNSIARVVASSSPDNVFNQNDRTRVCRDNIRIDRKWQTVQDFDFFPDSTDLVLMLLEDGLYVVEVDDRGWQNTQVLYPGRDLQMVLDGGRIYVKDRGVYLEVLTEIVS